MAKKKVVTTKQKVGTRTVKVKSTTGKSTSKIKPTLSKSRSSLKKNTQELTFDKENYKWIGIGFAAILIGLLLMLGGSMPSPDVWDESIIYSFRRITLSPIVIVAGLGIVVYGVFK